MPKFGSENKVNTDVARESEAKSSVEKPSLEISKASASSAADKNIGAIRRTEKTPMATAREAGGSGWVSQWGSKLTSLVSQKPKSASGAIPRFNGAPVQGELSLENIKVVRNDLSDTDLEVVTRKMAPQAMPTFLSAKPAGLADRNVGVTAPAKTERQSAMVEAVKS